MHCSLGLLLCACIAFGLYEVEGLQCYSCEPLLDGSGCISSATRHELCLLPTMKCGVLVVFEGPERNIDEVTRGCFVPRKEACDNRIDNKVSCGMLCDGDDCNQSILPPKP